MPNSGENGYANGHANEHDVRRAGGPSARRVDTTELEAVQQRVPGGSDKSGIKREREEADDVGLLLPKRKRRGGGHSTKP